ncbi:4,5-DOPA dioxygenase extradiol [Variovorax sp. J22G21]|uniref:4,5-DOPA-extradiol-dioxygenase n=1 Tax=Variovorax fucosicus TaxID=3053517 RepID=UPI00257794B1|nr:MULTISPECIES: 4,5-DOPA dioxygenase extradiol [unclassified Variovorax]MDM0041359.1 4,5-DOPA dioxygenase extradiol [Variovorax sp. J22R193]MDM0057723.1 4,5-DOPA dioxygenase extradiol [Variovorax sp. J22G47]MDM0060416.1 4,5-DOPA dioxygenase extradiol [Variovorax sp. J22G21]
MIAPLPLAGAFAAEPFRSLKKSPRLPVLFVGHGSPMNAIGDNAYRRSWQALGAEFGAKYPAPQLILCVSAHWLTRDGWYLTGMAKPRTIHDFGGFPQALFDQQYPAPGAPQTATDIAKTLRQPFSGAPVGLDASEWGFDHGTWSVLKPMFPKADIPVLQLSMDYSRSPAEHYQLGQQLRMLRERGVLVVGSGNIVHNLRASRREAAPNQAYDWAIEFDRVVGAQIEKGQLAALPDFKSLGSMAAQAHPTHEHYLPLLYAAAAVQAGEAPRFFNADFQSASISMRSVLWS